MDIPVEIVEVMDKIKGAGEEVYLVGGAVRNLLLGMEVNDYDLTTSSMPDKIEAIFSEYKTVDIGKKFGTILVLYKDYKVEITTFRKDGLYINGRRPESIEFSKELREDLERRDFTINAMALDENSLIDYFHGREDLKGKLIRTVKNPYKRFEEDYLRILRAVRFASQLNFQIEEKTYEAILSFKDKIVNISSERIRDEFFKILLSDNPGYGIELLRQTRILEIILPEISRMIGFNQESMYHDFDLYQHSIRTMEKTPKDLELRLAALFHDLGKLRTKSMDDSSQAHYYGHNVESRQMVEEILKDFNTDKKTIKSVGDLVYYHMINNSQFKDKGIKRLIGKIGEDNIYKLIDLQLADRESAKLEKVENQDLLDMKKRIELILSSQSIYQEKQLAINGNDVIELGYKKGPLIGEILSFVLDRVLEDEELNEKNILRIIIDEAFKDRREN